jgi:hypothetical protein
MALGEQIEVSRGKITGQRVLGVVESASVDNFVIECRG